MQKPTPEKPPDVPLWVMTYTDVITLLMTFFILLLTFATSEPEAFEKMRTHLFERAGVAGLIGHTSDEIERDAIVYRARPSLARLGIDGSEMPPTYQDPGGSTIQDAVAGLDAEQYRDPTIARTLELPLVLLVSEKEEISPAGGQLLRTLGFQLRKLPLQVCFMVGRSRDLPRLMALAEHLTAREKVGPGRVGVSLHESPDLRGDRVRIVITWHAQESP